MKKFMERLFLMCLAMALFACGGGGGSGTGGGSKVEPDPVQATAVVKLFSEGILPEGISLSGIGVSIDLPAGMTVKTDTTGKVVAGAVAGSGVTAGKAALAEPDYTPATETAPARLSFVLAGTEAEGFGVGEFAAVTCEMAAGTPAQALDIQLADFKPVDLRGAPVEGLTVSHTADFN